MRTKLTERTKRRRRRSGGIDLIYLILDEKENKWKHRIESNQIKSSYSRSLIGMQEIRGKVFLFGIFLSLFTIISWK